MHKSMFFRRGNVVFLNKAPEWDVHGRTQKTLFNEDKVDVDPRVGGRSGPSRSGPGQAPVGAINPGARFIKR